MRNGKDFYRDLTAASTNSVKTQKALERCYCALEPIGRIRKYSAPKITAPGYRYSKTSYENQEIVVDISGYSITMVSNRPGSIPQEVRLNKTTEGAITHASFNVAMEHFRGVNNLINGHYKFRNAGDKIAYDSAVEFFKKVVTPMNQEAIRIHRERLEVAK